MEELGDEEGEDVWVEVVRQETGCQQHYQTAGGHDDENGVLVG